jgi:hypothetical protein
MVVLTVGTDEGGFTPLPAMRDVVVLCKSIEFFEADETYQDRLKFTFQIERVGDEEHEEHIGAEHFVYANMPQGKTGKLSPRSNLYKLLEAMSGGEFDPDDEIDTDPYEGKRFHGDFKRVPKMKKVGDKFVTDFNEDGTPKKKTELTNIRPVRARKRPVQDEFDWEDDEAS